MTKRYTYLNEVTDKTKGFKLKVRVIQKGRPTSSPNKRYQRLIFADDKGNEMRGTLFEDDITKFEEALQQGGEYEISDVPIRPVPQQYANKPNEYQMNFNDRVRVIPITADTAAMMPKYHNILSVPRNAATTNRFDVIGVVLFAEEAKTITRNEREQQVREIMLTDYSSERPIVLSLWDDLARSGSDVLNDWAQSFMVVGFTDMQISGHKGFSLRSSMSTAIHADPDDPKANALRQWVQDKETTLIDRRSKAMEIKFPSSERVITTIAEISTRKASSTWQDEKFWLKAKIPDADLKNLRYYLGCSVCGRRSEAEKNAAFKCLFCGSKESLCIPRVNFAFDAIDDSASMKFTIFNDEVEKLFGMQCAELIELKKAEQTQLPEQVLKLRSKDILLQLGPTSGLTTSQMLKWMVRAVAFE